MAVTAAWVEIEIQNNVTWIDAFEFGTPDDTSWSFTGQNFKMDIKSNKDQATPLLTLTSTGGTIVVDDAVQRILHTNVPDTTVAADLPVGEYRYDFIMYDASSPPVRVVLMTGTLKVVQGITGN